MNIQELMDGIRKMDLVMPEFQREYVWTREQAKQLMVSLFLGYPTGALLVWKTDNPPEIKNAAITTDKIGTTLVILDGQQRLTTLFLLTQGEIPPYYKPADIDKDPRGLYFDLDTGDFQYYQALRMAKNPTWVKVVDCFDGSKVDPFQVAEQKAVDGQDRYQLAQRYNQNLNHLRNILVRDYPVQTVPSEAHIDDAIDVFDRVNSLGTKLADSELALAHITGKWPQARQVMKDKIAELSAKRFAFDLTFMVRSLVGVVHGRALFEVIHQTQAPELKAGWERLNRILDYLVTVLPGHAQIHSTEDLNTTNVLVPAVVYLASRGMKFEADRELRRFVHWLYAATIWARYTSQTDQRLDHDIAIIQRSKSPWRELVDAIIEQRGRIKLKPADLDGRGIQHPLYRMTFVMAKRNGAVDWFNGSPLDAPQGKAYAIHSHHIFPQGLLYSDAGGFDPENKLHKMVVNEIANRAFLTGQSNISLGATEPAEYLPRVEAQYPGALAKQFIPMDPALWHVGRFNEFLAARRRLIADATNGQMEALLKELEAPSRPTLRDILEGEEGPVLEFKASLRYDYGGSGVPPKVLQKSVAKSVAAFMNSDGGTLLIGVADDKTIVGIERDYPLLGERQNRDGFEQTLVSVLISSLGEEFLQFVTRSFEGVNGATVCVVDVKGSPRPVYLADGDKVEFYVRIGNVTRSLDPQATVEYIGMHWAA